MSVPKITTPRLHLRGHRVDDFPASFAMWSDPQVTRFIGKPSTEQQAWMRILSYAGHWALLNYGFWAVEERASGHFVGELGFFDFKRDVGPHMRNVPEMGWAFTPAVHGRGYASEAVAAAVRWGEAHFGQARTVCIIAPQNAASLRVAEKSGFRPFETSIYLGDPVLYLERLPAGGLTTDARASI